MRGPEVTQSGGRLIHLTINPDAKGGKWTSPQKKLDAPPVHVHFVSGFTSINSRDLGDAKRAALAVLPEGSTVSRHRFATGANIALVNHGLPRGLREREVRRIGDEMKEIADTTGKAPILVTYSLGGVQSMESWVKNPEEASGMVAFGPPFRMPGVGMTEKPETGQLHVIYGTHDLVVFPPFTRHGQEDTRTAVSGGHFSLPVSKQGLTAMTEALVQIVEGTPAEEKVMQLAGSSAQ